MRFKFNQTVRGSSANTGRAVVRLGKGAPDTSLILPVATDLTKPEGLRAINERFDQIERAIRHIEDMEITLAAKFAYGALETVGGDGSPVLGAKLVLDKLGTWLVLATFDWSGSGESLGYVVIDPEAPTSAKRQDAICRATATGTTTAWCLFTATAIPRLAQLYAKAVTGAWEVLEAGTSICALWVGRWAPGNKRFGRNVPTEYIGATDMNGDPLTDHGEEARWPASDHPDQISHGVELIL